MQPWVYIDDAASATIAAMERGTPAVTSGPRAKGAAPVTVSRTATGDLEDELPCQVHPADLWFSEVPGEVEQAKHLCQACPIRTHCLTVALARREAWGVWGGQLIDNGGVVARKRPRGRPRKIDIPA